MCLFLMEKHRNKRATCNNILTERQKTRIETLSAQTAFTLDVTYRFIVSGKYLRIA